MSAEDRRAGNEARPETFGPEFARRADAAQAIDAREFSILGRRLYAAYERKAGKIDTVNPGVVPPAEAPY